MTELKPSLSVIYAGGDLSAAFRAVEQTRGGDGIVIDDVMARRISEAKDYQATITRVIDAATADLELHGVQEGDPRHRFAVKYGSGPNTFRFSDDESSPSEANSAGSN